MKPIEERDTDELDIEELGDVVGGIDTVPLPELPAAIGTWPTPERGMSFFNFWH